MMAKTAKQKKKAAEQWCNHSCRSCDRRDYFRRERENEEARIENQQEIRRASQKDLRTWLNRWSIAPSFIATLIKSIIIDMSSSSLLHLYSIMEKISRRTVTETLLRLARRFSYFSSRSNAGDDISRGCDSGGKLFLEGEHGPWWLTSTSFTSSSSSSSRSSHRFAKARWLSVW